MSSVPVIRSGRNEVDVPMSQTKMDGIRQACSGCVRCGLSDGRTNLVFGVGNSDAEVLLIGEGPGEQEDLQGIPFVGPAGKLLDTMLELIDLDRTKVYIANMVKCRPPHNRDPRDDEIEACRPWLDAQIAAVSPKIIICLGRIAACALIRKDFRITREHGEWFPVGDAECTAVYHPSALLRDPEKRPETFEDLRAIRAKIKEICERTYD